MDLCDWSFLTGKGVGIPKAIFKLERNYFHEDGKTVVKSYGPYSLFKK
jgi:hypothetical protein